MLPDVYAAAVTQHAIVAAADAVIFCCRHAALILIFAAADATRCCFSRLMLMPPFLFISSPLLSFRHYIFSCHYFAFIIVPCHDFRRHYCRRHLIRHY